MTLLEHSLPEFLHDRGMVALGTERLVLRAPQQSDAKTIARLASDRRVAENTARIPHPYTLAHAQTWIESARAAQRNFVVTDSDNTILGACGLTEREAGFELGYWIGAPFWGCGYATEAVRGVIDHAFADLGMKELQAGARVTNPASRRVLEKCGFQWVGVGLYRINALNSSAPIDRFRLDRRIWESLKSWGPMRRTA